MVVGSSNENNVVLVADELLMQQQPNMNLFTITESHLFEMSYPKEGVMMVIKLKRKITSEMLTTYLPSMLLMMITYATTFFKPFFFEAALSVNLTTMLVMTTIFISKMEGLPPTSDTKMIDYWLILCQLVPFAQVVLLTIREYLKEEEQDTLEKENIQPPTPTKDSQKVSQEDEANPKEAWTISEIKPSKANSVTLLTMIGNVLIIFLFPNPNIFSEKKLLPLSVLFASIVYFAIAASFYFE